MSTNTFVGIDWGTHSSKICITSNQEYVGAPLFSSNIVSSDGKITFGKENHENQDEIVRGLKGDLITHSLASPFWSKEDRGDTGTSIGEAVTFSIACLISEAKREMATKLRGSSFEISELGFSFPNWLAEDSRKAAAAAKHFCEATRVAMAVVSTAAVKEMPYPRKAYSIDNWKRVIAVARAAAEESKQPKITLESANKIAFSLPSGGPQWRFIVESGAAGIPYLRIMQIPNRPGVAGLGKLLIVDVGAGSTDVGYMLRTSSTDAAKPTFYHLRPAPAFPVAGNHLTHDLLKHYRAQNRIMGYPEAEAQKTSGTSWSALPFVTAWIKQICDHVENYVIGIPDERWLPDSRPLNVVVTGGSGLVPTLKEKLVTAVKSGLRARKFHARTCDAVVGADRYEPRFDFRSEAEVARRAVCFGAADPDKPGFRYIDKFDPYKPSSVRAASSWV